MTVAEAALAQSPSPTRLEVIADSVALGWRYALHDSLSAQRPLAPADWNRLVEVENKVFGAESLLTEIQSSPQAMNLQRAANSLREIGLASHNFHDTYRTFPGPGHKTKPEPGGGLSWRVWLLPFLNELQLYNQFKLDEPWDSPHNKALIGQMPDVYRTGNSTQPGMTSLHLFTGPHAPFAPERDLRIADVLDGTSRTLLVILAGAETATEWTRPGGIEFDPAQGAAQLGTPLIPEGFPVVLMDGSAQLLASSVNADTLTNHVDHDNGQPLEDTGALGRLSVDSGSSLDALREKVRALEPK
jgi:hypothetical protein